MGSSRCDGKGKLSHCAGQLVVRAEIDVVERDGPAVVFFNSSNGPSGGDF